ncbi:MAG: hypothetical protein JXB88_25875 [Spirochaetales bacterium]|nr:hypothetical protein [Spirochaetales bacterium]
MNQKEKTFQTGCFDKKTNEYILSNPRTPMPWMHYLFNKDYTALVSVTGGGYSFYKSAKNRRILRARPNNVPFDRPGRYIYIKDNKTGDFHSAGWAPVMKDLDQQTYLCRLGAGFLMIESEYNGIFSELTYFVPMDHNLEIWRLVITNRGEGKLDLSLFTYAEFALFDAMNDRDNYQYTYNIASCYGQGDYIFHNTLYYHYHSNVYFCSSERITGYECSRELFIGPYNTEANPKGVLDGTLSNKDISGGNPCAAQKIAITLDPGEKKEIIFVLGIEKEKEQAIQVSQKYFSSHYTENALAEVKNSWQKVFNRFIFKTPSADINSFINFWNPYQMRTTFYLSRGPSIYEGGINRGMGFRDSNQDAMGPAYQLGRELSSLLSDLISYQYIAGDASHGYFSLTNEGYGKGYSDDHLWLIYSVCNYIKETGDLDFLKQKIPYIDATKEETVQEHLGRALDFTRTHCGDHNIPLAFTADWNDCLNLHGPNGKGESVWTGFLYHKALLEIIELCRVLHKDILAEKYKQDAREIKDVINATAWDGNWYVRAFDDYGNPVGTEKEKEGKIYLNAQSWAVYSGVAPHEKGKTAMDMAREKCNSEHGLALLWPAYTTHNPLIGSITGYPPGLKENGGIFCHANTWAIIAECLLARGDHAFEYYEKLLPTHYNRIASLHKSEPYVYSQVIAGPAHPEFGLARNSWLTGTASWMFIAFTQYILGIRPYYTGLFIDPCLPRKWDGYKVTRHFRNTMYHIDVENPAHVSKGVKEIYVDGKRIEGNLVHLSPQDQVQVKVIMGD